MENILILAFAAIVGLSHAFEADHLIAVSNIVTRRSSIRLAFYDGIYWGLGHTTTILLIGILIILLKMHFPQTLLDNLEALVGIMLVVLGIYRLMNLRKIRSEAKYEAHPHHHLAYGVGMIHGLAGSGALILLVMSQIQNPFLCLAYLLIFGLGSVLGMLIAAVGMSLAFYKKLPFALYIRMGLVLISSSLCLGYGSWVIYEVLGNLKWV